MVFKAIRYEGVDFAFDTSGDLYNEADFYGYFDDTVYVINEDILGLFFIATYRGNDLIDSRDSFQESFFRIFAGAGNDTVLGGKAQERVSDQSGNDRYLLGGGSDDIFVGTGNDFMDGGNGFGDSVLFGITVDDLGNISSNFSGVTVDLAITTAQDFGVFGRDTLRNFESASGSRGNDRLFGTDITNNLSGDDGRDLLVGRGGADDISGGEGRDTLIGGKGVDELVLNEAGNFADMLRYLTINDSGLNEAKSDFVVGFIMGEDRIDLSAIDARPATEGDDAFVFRGDAGFRFAAGEVRFENLGNRTLIFVDTDADAAAEMVITLRGPLDLSAGDFIL